MLGWLGIADASAGRPDFLIQNWLAKDGIPENSALAVAQTPDGYLWVGSSGGLLRFDGVDFTSASQISDLIRLKAVVISLRTDRSGRLWISTDAGLALYDHGNWQRIQGTNFLMRSIAEDAAGRVVLGGFEGQLATVKDDRLELFTPPEGLTPSGVFCLTDAKDGGIWLANRGFIGRLTPKGWSRMGPSSGPIANSLIAPTARAGGIWVYYRNELRRFQSDGTVTSYAAPEVDQPRELLEDSSGYIWVASNSRGLARFQPGGQPVTINSTNGLSHNSIWCIIEDQERNIWAGGSIGGLHRLKLRQFVAIGMADGLPDNIVRTVTEESPGQILVGTHGGGSARIHDGKVVWVRPSSADPVGLYSWSLLRDKSGRLWTGTYNGGILVEENGIEHPFPLPLPLGRIINCLMEDSHGRIWFGAFSGSGVIEGTNLLACSTNTVLAGLCVVGMAEDPRSGAIYLGTYDHGVYRLENGDFNRITNLQGIHEVRISSLTMDSDGFLWVGLFGHGLACVHDGTVGVVGAAQGLPAEIVGSMLDDGLGWFWLGTSRGILSVRRDELHRVAKDDTSRATFNVFNESDGLDSEYCTEGHQPAAVRDANGHLWFGTSKGVVTVDPAKLHLNAIKPRVLIERVGFADTSGSTHIIFPTSTNEIIVPPGSVELDFAFDVLSYTAPEKVRLAYLLTGADGNWVEIGNRRDLHFRALAPGNYSLRVKAANNDGVWNETGATLAFQVQPFIWQTLTFRLLFLAAVAVGGGFTAWRFTHDRLAQRIVLLQQQRAFEQERARLATVMEATSDLVVFTDSQGAVLHINPAGQKLLGLAAADLRGLTLAQLQPRWAAERVASEGIPAARQHGTWESETALVHRDGHEIPVSQVIVAHKDTAGRDSFISTIARDITERRKAQLDLQRREERFRLLIENGSDMITVMNRVAVISFQSPSSERVLGFKPEEMVGHSLMEFIHPDDASKSGKELKKILNVPGGSVTVMARFKHRDGNWRLLEAVGRSLPGESADGQLILNARDITESKKLEEQFRQAQKMEAIGHLAGGVAHDFNNILAASLMQLSLLQEEPNLAPEVRSALKDLEDGANRAAGLTRQLLVFSRRQVMEVKTLDFNQLLAGLVRMLRRLLGEHIELLFYGQADAAWVEADTGMMEQVVTNLCVNARDAMMPNGGRLTIGTGYIELDEAAIQGRAEARAGKFICLSVADTGCGMDEATMKKAFEPFFTTKGVGKGTGLGLATVFGIVNQHRGWIEVASEVGVGSVFHIFLPAHEAPDSDRATSTTNPFTGGRETILIVEDNESLRMVTSQWLQRLGYHVLEATNGAEALERWHRHGGKVDLLLTDMVMPGGMSGLELAEQLRALEKDVKVIICSGYSLEIAQGGLLNQRGIGYLAKPYEGATLATMIRKCLDGA